MTTFADMGYWMARAKIDLTAGENDEVPAELLIVEPGEDDSTSVCVTITGFDNLVALRDCIQEEINKYTESYELLRQDVPQ